jgi:hypothetical protein
MFPTSECASLVFPALPLRLFDWTLLDAVCNSVLLPEASLQLWSVPRTGAWGCNDKENLTDPILDMLGLYPPFGWSESRHLHSAANNFFSKRIVDVSRMFFW